MEFSTVNSTYHYFSKPNSNGVKRNIHQQRPVCLWTNQICFELKISSPLGQKVIKYSTVDRNSLQILTSIWSLWLIPRKIANSALSKIGQVTKDSWHTLSFCMWDFTIQTFCLQTKPVRQFTIIQSFYFRTRNHYEQSSHNCILSSTTLHLCKRQLLKTFNFSVKSSKFITASKMTCPLYHQ